MDWIIFDVRRKHGFAANYVLIAVLFLAFWLPWVVDFGLLDRFALKSIALPGLLAHPFLHVHSLHLAWNLTLLFLFGSLACNELGAFRYLLLFVVFTVVAGCSHVLLDGDRAIGASGGIAGFVAMTLVAWNRVQVVLFGGEMTVKASHIGWALMAKDVVFLLIPGIQTSVAGHFGGYLTGVLAGCAVRYANRRST